MKHANRPVDRSRSASLRVGAGRESPMKSSRLSIVPLLLFNRDISTEARRALVESRLGDVAQLLMHDHGLNCVEVGDLLDVAACP